MRTVERQPDQRQRSHIQKRAGPPLAGEPARAITAVSPSQLGSLALSLHHRQLLPEG
jgi:hypothetical protein